MLNTVREQWMGGDHIIYVNNSLLGWDPCPNTTKKLFLMGDVYEQDGSGGMDFLDFFTAEGDDKELIDLSKGNDSCRSNCDD